MNVQIACHALHMLPTPDEQRTSYIKKELEKYNRVLRKEEEEKNNISEGEQKLLQAIGTLPHIDVYTKDEIYEFRRLSAQEFIKRPETKEGWCRILKQIQLEDLLYTMGKTIDLVILFNGLSDSPNGCVLYKNPSMDKA